MEHKSISDNEELIDEIPHAYRNTIFKKDLRQKKHVRKSTLLLL